MSSRTLLYVVRGIAAAIIAAVAVYVFMLKSKLDEAGSAPTPAAVAAAPTPSAAASPVAPSAPTPAPATAAAAPAPVATPAFDVVRIEPSGDTVVAGRAAPNAAIVLNDGDHQIGEATADFSGEFVILPPTLSPGSHPLRLSAKVGGAPPLVSDVYVAEVTGAAVVAKPSASVAVAAVPAAPAALASAAPTPTAVAAATPTPAVASPPPQTLPAPPKVVVAARPTTPASPPAAAPSPAASAAGEIVVASVRAVDPAGLEAEGSAPPGANIRLRLNDTLLAEAVAGPDGKWSLTIQRGLTPGDYVLQAEIVDAAGAKVAHADAPFVYPQREAAAIVAAPQASPSPAATPQASPSQVAAAPAAAPLASAPQVAAPQASPSQAAAPLASPPATPAAVASARSLAANATPAAEPTPTASVAALAPTPTPSSPAATPAPAASATVAAPPAPPTTTAEPASTPVAEAPVATTAHPVVAEVRTLTVVKGDNLWDLARHFYGDGLRYADLYSANSTQIHDPNLIYVGQIFVVPQAAPAK